MIELRDYQSDLLDRSRLAMESGKRAPLIVAPCGAGKTVMFSELAHKTSLKQKRMLILSHRDELVEQISETLQLFNVPHSFIAAGRPYNPNRLVQIASVLSLGRRLESIPAPDLIVPDEAHHGVAGTWKKIFVHWPLVRRLGFTATPIRLSGEALGELFDDMIVGPTAGELIQMGYLSPYHVIAPPIPELELLRRKGADFDKKEVSAIFRKPKIVGDAVANYIKYAAGKRAVAFCVTVEEAKLTAATFQAAGFRSACIDGSMARGARKELVKMFREGFIDILTTCDLISEGFDLPAIEVAIMLRPTESLALWIQQFGRALRIFKGKERAIILDHANNTIRHLWLPESDIEWSLEGKAKVGGTGSSGKAVRICPFCFTAQFSEPGIDSCKFCGTLFTTAGKTGKGDITKEAGELVPISPEDLERIARARRIEQGTAETFPELVEVARRRNMNDPLGWAKNVWRGRQEKAARLAKEKAAREAKQARLV